MRIAVNTRLMINDIHGGIEWFSYECLKRICTAHPEHEFIFLFDRPYDEKFIFSSNIEPHIVKPTTIHPLFWYIWLEYKVPTVLRKTGADLFLSPDGMMPLRTDIPCIPVIHDINFYHRRHDLPRLKSLYYRKYFKLYAQKARRVVTVSEYSKQDMVRSWNIDPGKIDVVYNGAADEFSSSEGTKDTKGKKNSEDIIETSGTKATRDTKPYFLFVGNLSPRKNAANLVLAYERYRKELKGKAELIIAGDRLFMNRETDRIYMNSDYKNDIHFVGRKSRDELRSLYSEAIALVFVPWFEGFGIPLVEAMKCGTAVIASDTTSMPEIAGDAARLVNPSDTKAIAREMLTVEKDENLRKEMIRKGFLNSKKYTWDKTADLLWQSIEKSIKQG